MKLNIHIAIVILLSIALVNAKLAMIIRHGEKISDASSNLAPRGRARAYCLINLFGNNGTYVTPQKIYAQSPTEKKQSTRPRDTVKPLGDALGLEIDLSYTSGQIKKLTKNIKKTAENVVLVSWSNDNIPEIAEKFGINNPPKWDGNIFDDIWMIHDSDTPSYYNTNGISKREIYDGSEGYTMEIVKQDVEECINENVSQFIQSTSNTSTNTINSYINNENSSSTSSASITNKTSSCFLLSLLFIFISLVIAH